MSLDLSAAVAAHHPVKGGSSQSNIRGGYTGDWVICSCDPGDAWSRMATRIPIGEYPAHLLAAAAPLIEAQVRAQVADAIRARIAAEPEWMHVTDWRDGMETAEDIAGGADA